MNERDRYKDRNLAPLEDVIALARTLPLPPDNCDVEEQRAQLIALSERPARSPRMRRAVLAIAVPALAAAAAAAVIVRRAPVSVSVPTISVLPQGSTDDLDEPRVTRNRDDLASTSSASTGPHDGTSSLATTPRSEYRTTSVGRKTASAGASQSVHPEVAMVGMSNATLAGSASELAFQRGIASLQAGNFSRAITELEKVVADPGSPVIEDGRFWIAVAYARAKRTHAAIDAFERFLEQHPTSVRFREASTMLGWQLFAMGDRDRARALFKQGIGDANPTVNRSARAGLEMIDDRAQVTAK